MGAITTQLSLSILFERPRTRAVSLSSYLLSSLTKLSLSTVRDYCGKCGECGELKKYKASRPSAFILQCKIYYQTSIPARSLYLPAKIILRSDLHSTAAVHNPVECTERQDVHSLNRYPFPSSSSYSSYSNASRSFLETSHCVSHPRRSELPRSSHHKRGNRLAPLLHKCQNQREMDPCPTSIHLRLQIVQSSHWR